MADGHKHFAYEYSSGAWRGHSSRWAWRFVILGVLATNAWSASPSVVYVAALRPVGVLAEQAADVSAELRAALSRQPAIVVVDPDSLGLLLTGLGSAQEACGNDVCAEDMARAAEAEWVVTGVVRGNGDGPVAVEVSVVFLGGDQEVQRAEVDLGAVRTEGGTGTGVDELASRVAARLRGHPAEGGCTMGSGGG